MKFDLHIHTNRHSPDSSIDPLHLIRRARQVGLDGIVITEHDWLWTEGELAELRAAQPDLVILAGIEVSAQDGHLLVYGVTDPFAFPRHIPWADACLEAHRQGGVAVAAHPYRWGQPFDKIMRKQKPEIDGLEMMSKNMDDRDRFSVRRFHDEHPHLARFGNSDAHEIDQVGRCHTDFAPLPVRTNTELVAAIKARAGRPSERGAT